MKRTLRIGYVLVQPILFWDDGENLIPGPTAQPVQKKLRDLSQYPTEVLEELERYQKENDESMSNGKAEI